MRKFRIIAVTVVGLLALSAVAFATQVNTYSVTASTSPTTAGTKKKPVPIQLTFNYKVGEQTNQRPSPVQQYKIQFNGLQANTNPFKSCTADSITTAGSDAACPKAAVMGHGNIQAYVGPTNDPSNKSLFCYLALTFYNGGKNHAALYLKGDSAATDPAKKCVTDISQAIDATFVKNSKGTSLNFTVPPALLHPIAGLDSAVFNVGSTINKVTTKVKGKKVGFFQSTGGCVANKRPVTVTFVSENGTASNATTNAKCKK
ncbi:MAG: hypothetical protein JWM71_1698 [Solirubrobacteraceae bacterium]|nr:hypothetical protein [Solirubrobacteraceae bacterium]